MTLPPLSLRPLSELISSEDSEVSYLIKERMTQALRYLKDSTDQHILAQVWVPIENGGRCMLTTSEQPFVLDPYSNGLHQYRMVSMKYKFIVDGECDGYLGLPGRVFQMKLPEWTPNVQYYSRKEYPRLTHALHYNVQGSLALPVFEPSDQSCVAVLELIMTSQKINYASDVGKICKALEAVNLRSSEMLDHPNTQICDEGCQNALTEILEILSVVCETHKLPLAQTWVPCRHRSVLSGCGIQKKGCIEQVYMSTSDKAFYLIDAHIWGFREACVEHHLQKGQGVAGRAFLSRNSCFCDNITQFNKKEYPLVHYARMFRLTSCFAICLRSTHTGNDDYVLEFFLPPSITDRRHQQALMDSLLDTMKQHFRSLEVAMGEEISVEVLNSSIGDELHLASESIRMPQTSKSPPQLEALSDGRDIRKIQPLVHKLTAVADAVEVRSHKAVSVSENPDLRKTPSLTRKRGKKEKAISLEVLQQYFAGSLKDAAKSLGVCSTTMKRICRQHGISRWPSRKIKKVNHSLSKLKRVVESVQGVGGAISLTAFTGLSGSNQLNSPSSKPSESEEDIDESPTCKSPGSDELDEGDQMFKSVALGHETSIHEQSGFLAELGDGSNKSKTRSAFKEESMRIANTASHNSCHRELLNETATAANDLSKPLEAADSWRFTFQHPEVNPSDAFTFPEAVITTQPQEVLNEDAGSTTDLRNRWPLADDLPDSSWAKPPASTEPHLTRQDGNTVIIKASYREDIIRIRISITCGIAELKEEIAKRLKLEVGVFEIKYLDDDREWVLIACDADLQECVDVLRSSGSKIIRLLVHDTSRNLGSSR